MNKEDKSILLQDICARLPYKVICTDSRHGDSTITEIDTIEETVYCDDFDEYVELDKCKPYLRPMSSMTEDEYEEYKNYELQIKRAGIRFNTVIIEYFTWLNAHHFDYHGLIERGLALEALEGMYNE